MHLANSNQPDWADLLAAEWMDEIRKAYKNKGITNNISEKVIKKTAVELTKALDKGYLDESIDYNSPDEVLRQYLKNNVWKFSTAKNYNDCVKLSNLLVKEDGSIRTWNEFKAEANKVVGDSNRYLKTEYETIFASGQMARLWQKIQAEKAIFPYIQFVVVLDGHTTEICQPLHNVIVSVDDPNLALYFPLNHWGCRTTVKQLRFGKPTENVKWPSIPEAFQNNPGQNGNIFTDKNSYIANTPKDVLNLSRIFAERQQKFEELLKNSDYTDVEFGDMLGLKATHKEHNFRSNTSFHEKDARDILFNAGNEIILESEIAAEGIKTPDGFLNGKIADIKTVLGENGVLGKNNIANKLREGNKQGCEVVILYFPESSNHFYKEIDFETQINSAKNLLKKDNNEIVVKHVWILADGKIKKLNF